jgi:hypothetical protein
MRALTLFGKVRLTKFARTAFSKKITETMMAEPSHLRDPYHWHGKAAVARRKAGDMLNPLAAEAMLGVGVRPPGGIRPQAARWGAAP